MHNWYASLRPSANRVTPFPMPPAHLSGLCLPHWGHPTRITGGRGGPDKRTGATAQPEERSPKDRVGQGSQSLSRLATVSQKFSAFFSVSPSGHCRLGLKRAGTLV